METVIVRHSGPRAFLERAESWLLQREAENNLVLGLAASLAEGASGYSSPLYFATIERAGQVAGCAFRTPPYKIGLTRMPLDAAPLLARDVAEVYDHLPAALGPVDAVRAFGEAWAALRGVTVRPGPRQRIHSLEHVILPSPMAPGAVRPAGPDDISLVVRWLQSFIVATGHPETDAAALARRLAGGTGRDSRLALWEDGVPVSMAGCSGRTRQGVRIGYVYTPRQAPAQRLRERPGGHPQPPDPRLGVRALRPVHRPREPHLEQDLPCDRVPAGAGRDGCRVRSAV